MFDLAEADPTEGSPVVALGNPLDGTFSVTEGTSAGLGSGG